MNYFEVINSDILHLILLKLKSDDFNNFVEFDNEININYKYLLYQRHTDIAKNINKILSIDKFFKKYKSTAWPILYIDILNMEEDNRRIGTYYTPLNNFFETKEYSLFVNDKISDYNNLTILIFNCIDIYKEFSIMYEKRYYLNNDLYSLVLYNRLLSLAYNYGSSQYDTILKYLKTGKIEDNVFIKGDEILNMTTDSQILISLYLLGHEPNFNTFKIDEKIIKWIETNEAIDYDDTYVHLDKIKADYLYEAQDMYEPGLNYIRQFVNDTYISNDVVI
jgi:hypothetical protein